MTRPCLDPVFVAAVNLSCMAQGIPCLFPPGHVQARRAEDVLLSHLIEDAEARLAASDEENEARFRGFMKEAGT